MFHVRDRNDHVATGLGPNGAYHHVGVEVDLDVKVDDGGGWLGIVHRISAYSSNIGDDPRWHWQPRNLLSGSLDDDLQMNGAQTLVSASRDWRPIAFAAHAEPIYWIDPGDNQLMTATIAGPTSISNARTILRGDILANIRHISVGLDDLGNGPFLFWNDQRNFPNGLRMTPLSNLGGTVTDITLPSLSQMSAALAASHSEDDWNLDHKPPVTLSVVKGVVC